MNANALPRLLALAIGVALASPVLADGTPAAAAPDAVDAADGAAALEELRAASPRSRPASGPARRRAPLPSTT